MIHRTDALIVDAGLSELPFAVNLYLRQHSRRHDRKRIDHGVAHYAGDRIDLQID